MMMDIFQKFAASKKERSSQTQLNAKKKDLGVLFLNFKLSSLLVDNVSCLKFKRR